MGIKMLRSPTTGRGGPRCSG